MTNALDGWGRSEFTADGRTRQVYRRGTGPGVIVIHEIPGITPKVAAFANDVVASGFTVVMPSLVGTPGRATVGAVRHGIDGEGLCRPRVHGLGTAADIADHHLAAGPRDRPARLGRRTRRRCRRDVFQRRLRTRDDGRHHDGRTRC